MADRQQNFTDFRDPFDLLTSLHNTRLRMIYQNEFARGNRTDMNMGYNPHPTSQIGKTSMAQDRLQVNAPTRQFDRSVGSGSYHPSVGEFRINRSYSQPSDTAGRSAGRPGSPEAQRFGNLAFKLLGIAGETARTIGDIRQQRKDLQAYNENVKPLEDRRDTLEGASADINAKIQAKENINAARREFLNRRAERVQQTNAAAFKNTMTNLPQQALNVLPGKQADNPYGMLVTPMEQEEVGKGMGILNASTSNLPAPGTMAPGAPGTGVPGPSAPFQKDTNTATLSTAGQTPKAPKAPKAPKSPKGPKGPKSPPKPPKSS